MRNREHGWFDAGEVIRAYGEIEALIDEGHTLEKAKERVEQQGLGARPVDGHILPTYLYRSAEEQLVKDKLRKAKVARMMKNRDENARGKKDKKSTDPKPTTEDLQALEGDLSFDSLV